MTPSRPPSSVRPTESRVHNKISLSTQLKLSDGGEEREESSLMGRQAGGPRGEKERERPVAD